MCARELTSTPPNTSLQTQEGGKQKTRASADGRMLADRRQMRTARESRMERANRKGSVLRDKQIVKDEATRAGGLGRGVPHD